MNADTVGYIMMGIWFLLFLMILSNTISLIRTRKKIMKKLRMIERMIEEIGEMVK